MCTCHDTTACWSAKIVITSNYLVVHLHQTRLCCARSVGPFSPRQKEAKDVFFFPLLQNCFSRAAWNLFDFGNQLVPTHLANNMPFGSFQCSLEGLRHALILPLPRKLFFWGCMESSRFLGINWYQLIWQIHSTRCIPVLFALSLCLYVYP